MSAPENQKRVLAPLRSEAASPSQAAQLKPAAAADESGTGTSDDYFCIANKGEHLQSWLSGEVP